MNDGKLEHLLLMLGAPRGEPRACYRDLALTFVSMPVGLVGGVLGVGRVFNVAFWCCVVVFAVCVVAPTKRALILAAPLLFASARLVFGAAAFGSVELFVAAAGCVFAAMGILWAGSRTERKE